MPDPSEHREPVLGEASPAEPMGPDAHFDPCRSGQTAADAGTKTDAAGPFAVLSMEAPPVASNFCTRCGSHLDESGACAACAQTGPVVPGVREPGRFNPVMSALGLYFAFLGSMIYAALSIADGADPMQAMVWVGIMDAVLVIAWCLLRRPEIGPMLRPARGSTAWILGAVGSLVTFSVATGAVYLLRRMSGVNSHEYVLVFREHGYGFGMVVLMICVQPAIVEELAFRGVILGGLQRMLRSRDAVIVSAALFMVIHLAVPSFPHLLLMGVALGWLRVRFGSLYPCMLLHFLHNFYCVMGELGHGD